MLPTQLHVSEEGGDEKGGEGDATCTLSKASLLRMASSACSGLVHPHTPIVGFRSMAHRDLKSSIDIGFEGNGGVKSKPETRVYNSKGKCHSPTFVAYTMFVC